MKLVATPLLLCIALLHPLWVHASDATPFSFGVIAKPVKASDSETVLREAIIESDADNLAFVVASGIKAAEEPCSDSLCLLYTSPSPRDRQKSRMPSSA